MKIDFNQDEYFLLMSSRVWEKQFNSGRSLPDLLKPFDVKIDHRLPDDGVYKMRKEDYGLAKEAEKERRSQETII